MLEFKATLRISSKTMTLNELKEYIGEPTRGFSIGDEFSRGKRKREFSYWGWELTPVVKTSLELHIGKIVDILKEKQPKINEIADKIDIDIFCRISSDNGQGGAVFPSKLMKVLAPYGIDVVFDLYMEPEED